MAKTMNIAPRFKIQNTKARFITALQNAEAFVKSEYEPNTNGYYEEMNKNIVIMQECVDKNDLDALVKNPDFVAILSDMWEE